MSELDRLLDLVRPEVQATPAYDPGSGTGTPLHANEAPLDASGRPSGLNRYPDPEATRLREALGARLGVTPDSLLVTRGGDDGIDALIRCFCRPGADAVVVSPPTFGIYAQMASLAGVGVRGVPVRAEDGYQPDVETLLETVVTPDTAKILFLCSPNNPTGNLIDEARLEAVLEATRGRCIVMLDQAYVEFAGGGSWVERLADYPQLIILRTFSKAHALAGARCGYLVGDPELLARVRRVLPPYPLPTPSLALAEAAASPAGWVEMSSRAAELVARRERLARALARAEAVARVWPSAANYLLVEPASGVALADLLAEAGVRVRRLSGEGLVPGSVRITVGDDAANERLLRTLEVDDAA